MAAEDAVIVPEECICGINGCRTWYDDPVIMKRHRERQHGIGIVSLNQPLPRTATSKLA